MLNYYHIADFLLGIVDFKLFESKELTKLSQKYL